MNLFTPSMSLDLLTNFGFDIRVLLTFGSRLCSSDGIKSEFYLVRLIESGLLDPGFCILN